ncbi:MAG TPA: hypothetical protein VGD37_23520 [Kofleriaceae bacterium]|jgi:hypothetical protein
MKPASDRQTTRPGGAITAAVAACVLACAALLTACGGDAAVSRQLAAARAWLAARER